jgi:hypothetical protein
MKYNVLHNFISPITGRITCNYNYVPLGNSRGIAIPSPILIDIRLDIIKLRKELDNIVSFPLNADFVITTANPLIPKAQVLNNVGTGIIKLTTGGIITLATQNVDYITLSYLNNQLLNYVSISGFSGLFAADFAATFPAAFSSAFAVAFPAAFLSEYTPAITLSLATYTLTVLTPAINALNINLTGAITASGSLNSTVTTYFSPNPVFPGSASVTIPVGTVSQRPSSPLFGMVRANSDTNVIEYYTSSAWVTLNSSNATVSSINITGSTGLSISGSPITSSGTITLTLSSGLQDLSSYSSASFLKVANNLSDISNASTARINLGLSNIAIQNVTSNSILIGGGSNSIVSQALTNGQLLIGYTGAAPVATIPTNGTNISWTTGAGSLTANISGQIALSNGGTNANLIASNGGIFYSTTNSGAILSGTSTANQILLSGSSAAPTWSTATYPATTTINQLLYSSANNTLAGLATANNGILITGSSGVPSISSILPSAVQGNITATGIVTVGTWNGTTISVGYGGTGLSSTTAYGVLCGGTTSTGNLQNAGTGSSGYFLGGNGASTLPSWKTAVTSVAIASGSVGYGLSVSGSPITGNGTITVSLNNELMGVSQISSLGMIVRRTGSIYSTVQLTTSSTGLLFTNPDGVASNPQINLNAELQGVAVLSSTGLITRTASGTYATTTLTAGTGISVTNGNGVSGNPTIAVNAELQGLSGLSSTGIIVRTGSGTYTTRTITAGNSSITVNNGDGLTANPSITLGTVPIANLANYPSSSTQFLRGNGSWSQPTLNDIGSPTSGSTLDFNNSTITNLGSLSVNSTASGIPLATWFAYFKIQTTGIGPTYSATSGVWNGGGLPRSIICSGAISATEFESTSSIKKKNIISNYEDFKEELKEKFDTIDFVKYEWKDKYTKGFGEYYGYIAENVSKAFPELVNLKHTEYAPNILKYADLSHISGKNYRIIFSEDIEIEIGKKLKIINKNEKTFEAILTMKENNNSYLLSFLADTPNVSEILVYGSYEEVPLVSKTRFHDMSAARLKILIDEVSNLSRRIDKIENVALNL